MVRRRATPPAAQLVAVGRCVVSAGVLPGTLLLVSSRCRSRGCAGASFARRARARARRVRLQRGRLDARRRTSRSSGRRSFAGWAFLYLFHEVSLVVLIAAIIPVVDAISVFTPGAPTHEIVKHHRSVYDHVAVAFYGPGGRPATRPARHPLLRVVPRRGRALRLRVGWTWLAMTASHAAASTVATIGGLPALPFLSAGFLVANADLLWKAVRSGRLASRSSVSRVRSSLLPFHTHCSPLAANARRSAGHRSCTSHALLLDVFDQLPRASDPPDRGTSVTSTGLLVGYRRTDRCSSSAGAKHHRNLARSSTGRDELVVRSSSATHSTCGVCGNMSTGVTRSSS